MTSESYNAVMKVSAERYMIKFPSSIEEDKNSNRGAEEE